MDRALWFVMDTAARFKMPCIRVRKVAIDGVSGGHIGLAVGSWTFLITLSWSRAVQS